MPASLDDGVDLAAFIAHEIAYRAREAAKKESGPVLPDTGGCGHRSRDPASVKGREEERR